MYVYGPLCGLLLAHNFLHFSKDTDVAFIDRQCVITKYAKEHGGYSSGSANNSAWRLRSPGKSNEQTALVDITGAIYYEGIDAFFKNGCVRPATWLRV